MRTIKQYNSQRKLIFKLRKAVTLFDTGYIYAPYIPLQSTEVNVSFNHDLNLISSRYVRQEINPNYYGEINIHR